MARDLEYKFFREFQSDGAAIMSLNMMHFEYCGIGNELPARPDYPDGVLVEIRERTELFDIWPWGAFDFSIAVSDASPAIFSYSASIFFSSSSFNFIFAVRFS